METPGTILKREREAQGLTLKEISSITRIPVHSLRLLEDDRYDLLPAEVFAKGFLRNYGRELQLNPDELMLSYASMKGQRLDLDNPGSSRDRAAFGGSLTHGSMGTTMGGLPGSQSSKSKDLTGSNANFTMRKISPSVVFSNQVNDHRAPTSASMVESQRTFRFAYVVVVLVVAASVALSVLFTGTGEAEENSRQRTRSVVDTDDDPSSRFLLSDQNGALSAPAAAPDDTIESAEPLEQPAFPDSDSDSDNP